MTPKANRGSMRKLTKYVPKRARIAHLTSASDSAGVCWVDISLFHSWVWPTCPSVCSKVPLHRSVDDYLWVPSPGREPKGSASGTSDLSRSLTVPSLQVVESRPNPLAYRKSKTSPSWGLWGKLHSLPFAEPLVMGRTTPFWAQALPEYPQEWN